jgi:hypothetical protein
MSGQFSKLVVKLMLVKIIFYLVSAKEFLIAEGLQCLGSNIRCVIEISNPDVIYNVPNFCICDPIFEKDFTTCKEDEINQSVFNVIIVYVFESRETQLSVTGKTLGKDLKRLYADKHSLSLDKFRLRMLFKGQEIIDDHPLFYHKIENNSKIQVSIADLSI